MVRPTNFLVKMGTRRIAGESTGRKGAWVARGPISTRRIRLDDDRAGATEGAWSGGDEI